MKIKPLILISLALAVQGALAQDVWQNPGAKMGIDQKLGAQLPMDTLVNDEHGNEIPFGRVFNGRPVIFMPIFYECKQVCSLELENIMKSAVKMKRTFPIGANYDLVILSIHPKETPDLALAKEKQMQDMYDLPSSKPGWHFLTAKEANIHRITDAIGFRYEYNPTLNLVNHPSGIMILTPEGKVSSYIYGADYPTRVLQDSLTLASVNKVGRPAEVILFGCVMINPVTGQRTLVVETILKYAGILTVLILGISIFKMSLSAKKAAANGGTPTHA